MPDAGVAERYKLWPQLFSALSASLSMASGGLVIGWMSPATSLLLHPESGFHLTYNEIAWVASVAYLAAACGPILAVTLIDSLGRKMTLLSTFLFYTAGWIVALLAEDFTLLVVSRILGGIGFGISLSSVPLYVAEISENKRRGALGILVTLMATIGILYESAVGPYTTLIQLNGLSMIFPLLFAVTFIWVPESPHFLEKKRRHEEALESLMWLRGVRTKLGVQAEMASISKFVETSTKLSFLQTLKEITSKNNIKALMLTLVAFFGQQFSGMYAIASYTERIFRDIDSPINPPNAVALLAAVAVVFTFATSHVVDRGGRKVLLMASCLGMCASNILIGSYLILSQKGIVGEQFSWMGMLGLFGFKATIALGVNSVPYIILAEMFPSSTKTWSVCLIISYQSLLSFAVTKLFQVMDSTIGGYFAFFFFAFCLFLTFLYVYFFMSETKKMSMNEIQDKLNH